jgi:hypothetical protein
MGNLTAHTDYYIVEKQYLLRRAILLHDTRSLSQYHDLCLLNSILAPRHQATRQPLERQLPVADVRRARAQLSPMLARLC